MCGVGNPYFLGNKAGGGVCGWAASLMLFVLCAVNGECYVGLVSYLQLIHVLKEYGCKFVTTHTTHS